MNCFLRSKSLIAGITILTFFVVSGEIRAQNEKSYLETQSDKLKSSDIETRRDALHRLRTDQTAKSSGAASESLQDGEEIVRATAPFSVIYLPKDEAAAKLLPQLTDISAFVRRETVYALGETESLLAVQPLILRLQNDKERSVKAACAIALGKIGDVRALEILTEVFRQKFNDKDEFIRRSAARAIGQIAFKQQIRSFSSKNPQADLSKSKITYKNLSNDFTVFQNIVRVLAQVLQNPKESADVKRESAFALGEIGDDSVLPVLQTTLSAKDYYSAEIAEKSIAKIIEAKAGR